MCTIMQFRFITTLTSVQMKCFSVFFLSSSTSFRWFVFCFLFVVVVVVLFTYVCLFVCFLVFFYHCSNLISNELPFCGQCAN